MWRRPSLGTTRSRSMPSKAKTTIRITAIFTTCSTRNRISPWTMGPISYRHSIRIARTRWPTSWAGPRRPPRASSASEAWRPMGCYATRLSPSTTPKQNTSLTTATGRAKAPWTGSCAPPTGSLPGASSSYADTAGAAEVWRCAPRAQAPGCW